MQTFLSSSHGPFSHLSAILFTLAAQTGYDFLVKARSQRCKRREPPHFVQFIRPAKVTMADILSTKKIKVKGNPIPNDTVLLTFWFNPWFLYSSTGKMNPPPPQGLSLTRPRLSAGVIVVRKKGPGHKRWRAPFGF